ncbi:MAG: alkaline phosphatase family protein [Bacteroidetes bacterium]|nr:MAG: alkaline phosphatase family protein [Bacteroidota bacterium]
MRKLIWIALALGSVLPLKAQQKKGHLVIGIVVDQMRQDYLYRYESRFCDSGFKRLMSEGYVSHNCNYNYIPTYTGPGHASIYTGTTPAFHGIVGNDWFDRAAGRMMYCTEDSSVSASGWSKGQSPKNLLATTMTDQLRLASQFRSKVIGVSIKDRSSVIPAGHHPTGAYWFDPKIGRLTSSDYYHDSLPEWVNAFNRRALPLSYMEQNWTTLFPIESYTASAPDDNPYESRFQKDRAPVFPYPLAEIQQKWGYKLMNFTPFGNSFVIEAGKAAIEAHQLGQGSETDFLAMSFSATDYAGHFFGPQAVEVEDMYLRLDRDLAAFMAYLDKTIGKGNYTLFLTADHGGNDVPTLLNEHGMPGGLLKVDSLQLAIKNALKQQFGDSLVLHFINEQLYLDQAVLAKRKLTSLDIAQYLRVFLAKEPSILKIYASGELNSAGHAMDSRVYMGYMARRSGDICFLTAPGWMDYGATGTTHGSAFTYDTRVPFLAMGPGIQAKHSFEPMQITDIAPSISALLKIAFPNAVTGRVNTEMLKP